MPKPPRRHLTAAQRETKLANRLRQAALTDHRQATAAAYRSALWRVANRHRQGLPQHTLAALVRETMQATPWAESAAPLPYRFTWDNAVRKAQRDLDRNRARIDATPRGTPGQKAPDWSRTVRRSDGR